MRGIWDTSIKYYHLWKFELNYSYKMFIEESLNETPINSQLPGSGGNTYEGFTYQEPTYNPHAK